MTTKQATAMHYFVEVGDDLRPKVVGTSRLSNGFTAMMRFADKRYGAGNWGHRRGYGDARGRSYVIASDGRCLECCPFPPELTY